jgi:hypothetical protein
MIGDYYNDVSQRRYSHAAGSGSATVTIPVNAWVVSFSFVAGDSDPATLDITPTAGDPLPTITVQPDSAFDERIEDRGSLSGATFEFEDTVDYYIRYAMAV